MNILTNRIEYTVGDATHQGYLAYDDEVAEARPWAAEEEGAAMSASKLAPRRRMKTRMAAPTRTAKSRARKVVRRSGIDVLGKDYPTGMKPPAGRRVVTSISEEIIDNTLGLGRIAASEEVMVIEDVVEIV